MRWLGSTGDWDVYAFLTAGNNVCMTAVFDEISGGGSCTSDAEFRRQRIDVTTAMRPATETVTLAVNWGPQGEPTIVEERAR